MGWFTRLKHWQVFIFIGGPFVFTFLSVPLSILAPDLISPLFGMQAMMTIWMVSFMGYFICTGVSLVALGYKNRKVSFYLFLIFLSISLMYSVYFSLSFFSGFGSGDIDLPKPEFSSILPLHLFSMFANFYGIRFIAKALVSVEKNIDAKAQDYLGEFFLFWMLPIGIWALQPRLNKLRQNHSKNIA